MWAQGQSGYSLQEGSMTLIQPYLPLAAAFLIALLFGRAAVHVHAPRVTGYLLAGIIAGPSLAGLAGWPSVITWEALEQIRPVTKIALAFIVLTIGIKARFENIQRWGARLFKLSAYEIILTFLAVGTTVFILDGLFIKTFMINGRADYAKIAQMAMFFAVIAVATAPAATLFVIREYDAEGPLTEKIMILIGLNNLFSIVAYLVIAHVYFEMTHPLDLVLALGTPVLLGTLIGLAMSLWAQHLDKERDYQLLAIGGVILAMGLAAMFRINMMLTIFLTGLALANASPKIDSMMDAIQKIDYPFYVLFFVVSGAGMHLQSFAHVGLLGVGYILARTAGKYAGSFWGARAAGYSQRDQVYLGFTLMAQAGIAIGLSQQLAGEWAQGGHMVETVILGSLVIFELVGPLAVRYGLVRAGEVSLLSLLVKKASATTFEEVHQVINHFRLSLGLHLQKKLKSAADILVKHIMRRNVETVKATMHFNDFLKMVAFSRYDRFPVVDQHDHFIGVVDYSDIRDMIFDPTLGDLIIVGDLIKKNPLVINGDQSIKEILRIFRKHPDITYLPVVDVENSQKLVGMLNQNTVLSLFRSLND